MNNLGKKLYLFGFVLVITLFLASCAQNQNYPRTQVNQDLMTETWMQQMYTNPNQWTAQAGSWFYTGEPQQVTQYVRNAPLSDAMTNMTVRVPNFTNIVITGNFQVQLMGHQEANSVAVVGPNPSVRETAVDVTNNTLYIHQVKDAKSPCNKVIIRIGIRNLRGLTINGNGRVVGRWITSDGLNIHANGNNLIVLGGNMNVCRVSASGSSIVNILGAYTPSLVVRASGSSRVNICGRVGVQAIYNMGSSCVKILGADTDSLTINASGSSTTQVSGYANVKRINAQDWSKVYVYWLTSQGLYVTACNHAHVGLAGCANNINIELSDAARFDGQNLHVDNVYARTRGASHANISANQKMFAAAMDNSSIYFFGSPNIISRFTSGNGVVLPVWSNAIASPSMPYKQPTSWNFKDEPKSSAYTTGYGNSYQRTYK